MLAREWNGQARRHVIIGAEFRGQPRLYPTPTPPLPSSYLYANIFDKHIAQNSQHIKYDMADDSAFALMSIDDQRLRWVEDFPIEIWAAIGNQAANRLLIDSNSPVFNRLYGCTFVRSVFQRSKGIASTAADQYLHQQTSSREPKPGRRGRSSVLVNTSSQNIALTMRRLRAPTYYLWSATVFGDLLLCYTPCGRKRMVLYSS